MQKDDQPLPQPENVVKGEYDIAIAWQCECGHAQAIVDPQILAACLARQDIGVECPKCKVKHRLSRRRQLVQVPNTGLNRHARRAQQALGIVPRG